MSFFSFFFGAGDEEEKHDQLRPQQPQQQQLQQQHYAQHAHYAQMMHQQQQQQQQQRQQPPLGPLPPPPVQYNRVLTQQEATSQQQIQSQLAFQQQVHLRAQQQHMQSAHAQHHAAMAAQNARSSVQRALSMVHGQHTQAHMRQVAIRPNVVMPHMGVPFQPRREREIPAELLQLNEEKKKNPATAEQIAKMHLQKIGVKSPDAGHQTTCSICTDDFRLGEMAFTMPCTHRYHQSCLLNWLSIQNFCPMCRAKLSD